MEDNNYVLYNDKYRIYKDGRIYNEKSNYFLTVVEDEKSKVCYVNLYFGGKSHKEYINQLVAKAFLTKPESNDKLSIAHKDNNWRNNHADNLYWATRSEIMLYKHKSGVYNNTLSNNKKRIWLLDYINCTELQFESVTEAAMYLKSINDRLPDIKSVMGNLSNAATRDGEAYGYKVIIENE